MVHRLLIAYRGTAYAGWQRQDNALAVQQVVEEALEALLGTPVRIVGAGRTDAGVHARGQVAHLDLPRPLPPRGLVHGTNHHLPEDIRILAARPVAAGFHARKSALAKTYRYRWVCGTVISPLDAPFVAGGRSLLDVAAMRRAMAALPGRHDFSAFALAGGAHDSPVRRLDVATLEESPLPGGAVELGLRFVGEGFLRGMVRSLVGTLVEVGSGRRTPEDFAALLAGAPRDAAGPTAPARGLCLEGVTYDDAWATGVGDGYDGRAAEAAAAGTGGPGPYRPAW